MSIIVFGIKSCNSMKKTFTKLDNSGVKYEFHDYKKQSIDKEVISQWIQELGIDTILNKRGTTWRNQSDENKIKADSNQDFAIELLIKNTSMIKRPIVQGNHNSKDILLCGFDEILFDELFISID